MIPLWLTLPMAVIIQAPPAPMPEVEAKDLPPAARGPMAPRVRDGGAERGVLGETRRMARRGSAIPALQLPTGNVRVKDKIPDISGWRAYAIEVPEGGSVKVQVVDGRKAWFRVLGVNAWGVEEAGLLQNRIYAGVPRATYKNPGTGARTIYFIVDTLDAQMVGDEFTVEVTRG